MSFLLVHQTLSGLLAAWLPLRTFEEAGEVADIINMFLVLIAILLDPQPGDPGMRHVKACFTYSLLHQIFTMTSRDPLWDCFSCLA